MSSPSSTKKKPEKGKKAKERVAGPYRKPRADLFTMLLTISLMAVIAGCVFLYLSMGPYQHKFKGGPTVPPLPATAQAPAAPGAAK